MKDEKGKWIIPDGSIRPFYFDSKKATEQVGRKVLILQAINKEQTIPDERISAFEGRVDILFDELTAQGLIRKVQNKEKCEDKYRMYILSERGEQLLKQNGSFGRIMEAIRQLPSIQLHVHLPQQQG